MSAEFRYVMPVEETQWRIPASGEVSFTWDYDARSTELLQLYSKGKQQQWDAETRIDWSLEVDPDDPMQMDESVLPLYGTELWNKLSERQRSDLRYHSQVFNLSQFLHGEQGALVCAARIVKDAPQLESKFYAATQVMDEARHVEAYRRLLKEKFRFAYPISKPLKTLLEQALNDPRWDFTYLGMQVLIEGLALVAFQRVRDYSRNPLCQAVNAYVMQDEARHVAFGRLALRDYYPQLSGAARARGVRHRGLVPPARPLQFARDVGAAGLRPEGRAAGGGRRRGPDPLQEAPVLAHRPHGARHRPVERARARGLHRAGRHPVREDRRAGDARQRRPRRRRLRPPDARRLRESG